MTAQEVITKVISLIDETASAELTAKALILIDTVQKEIATIQPILKKTALTPLSGVVTLPTDLYKIVRIIDSNKDYVNYIELSPTTIEVDDELTSVTLFYYMYPTDITLVGNSLQISKQAQDALVYGVAAGLLIDDPQYDTFNAKYNNLLVNLAGNSAKATFVGRVMF